ncbi:MAG: hypothetical protein E7662_06495 [Ruminococcaceae bacterium]|nr:hypothetical protein [Oscillospiraceae bacterium]
MKKIAALLAVVMCLCALAAPVAALTKNGSYGKVPMYKGEIKIDGKVDDIYKKGLVIDIAGDYPNIASDATGKAYFLHDGTHVYMALEVNNVYPLGEYASANASAANAWKETGIELYFDWNDDGGTNDFKYMCWADGQYWESDSNAAKNGLKEYKATQDAAKKTYVMEAKVAMNQDAKTGSNVGWYIMVTSNSDPKAPKQEKIAVPTLLNNIKAANTPSTWFSFTLDSAEVKLDTTAATTKAPATTGSSAATFDAGIVLAVVAAAAGAGVVVSKKRH